jgi:LacI family transcriptional regulator
MSSIHEVAKQAGVSPATVSRTFRTPDLLSHQTRRRVLDVAAQLNYAPRPHGPRTAVLESVSEVAQALGFLFFASDADSVQINEFYATMLGGAQAEAGQWGRHLIMRTASRYERPREMPQMYREQAVAGTLLVGAATPQVLAAFDNPTRPCVLLDNRDSEEPTHDSVMSDGFGGAMLAVHHLLALGHRRILFVHNESSAPSFQDRRRGYLCALWESGIMPDPHWVVATEQSEPLEPRLAPLLSGSSGATAIVAANDWNALTALSACRSLGLRVPTDVSVIGFDDISSSVHAYPPLTTVRVDKEQMGRLAVRRLLSRIEACQSGASLAPPVQLTVPVRLVARASCAPPPSF